MIKAFETPFGDPKGALFQENDHCNYYEGWDYVGREEYCGVEMDLYYMREDRTKPAHDSFNPELFSFVFSNEASDYISPIRRSLSRHGNAGQRMINFLDRVYNDDVNHETTLDDYLGVA